jgi:hypothetical protein
MQPRFIKCLNPACAATATGISPNNPDNTAATNAAIQTLHDQGGGTLLFDQPGTYNYLGEVRMLDGVTLQGLGPGVTILSFAATGPGDFPDSANIYASGELVALPTIGAQIDRGDTSMTFVSDPALEVDDVFILQNTTDFSWSLDRPYYRAGEFYVVQAVVGAAVEVQFPSFDTYVPGADISVWRLEPVRVSIKGFTIIGNGDTTRVIQIVLGRGCVFEDLELYESTGGLLRIDRSYDTKITRCRGVDFGALVGLNYGLIFANSHLASVTDSSFTTSRHGFSTGGDDSDGAVPCRTISVSNCQIGGDALPGANVHGNGEAISFSDCEIDGGFVLGGVGHRITNNRVWSDRSNGFALQLAELVGYDMLVEGNAFYASRNVSTTSTYGLIVHNRVDGGIAKPNGTFVFANNTIDMGEYQGYPVYIIKRGDDLGSSLVLEGNVVRRNPTTDGGVQQFAVDSVDGSAFKRVVFQGNVLSGCGILANRACAETTVIKGNTIDQSMDFGIRVNCADPTPPFSRYQVEVTDNEVDRSWVTGIYVNGDANATQVAMLRSNTSVRNNQSGQTGILANGASITVATVNTVRMQANTIGDDQAVKTQIRNAVLTTIGDLYEVGTTRIGTITAYVITGVTTRWRDLSSILKAFTASVQIVPSAGWGAAPSIDPVAGINNTDVAGAFTVTADASGTGLGPDPTLTFTFPDGAWPLTPMVQVVRGDNAAPQGVPITWTVNTTSLTITFRGTPEAAQVYRFYYHIMGLNL